MRLEIIWSAELAAAARAIAGDRTAVPWREPNMADCRQRAGEMTSMRPGQTLAPHQIDFVTCLRQRLQATPAHAAFEAAWSAAYAEAEAEAAGGRAVRFSRTGGPEDWSYEVRGPAGTCFVYDTGGALFAISDTSGEIVARSADHGRACAIAARLAGGES